MSDTRLFGPIGVGLGDDPVEVEFSKSALGYSFARLHIGRVLTLHAGDASPAALHRLAAAAEELAVWREEQDAKAAIAAQVDAEDGVTKAVYVPFNRQPVAA